MLTPRSYKRVKEIMSSPSELTSPVSLKNSERGLSFSSTSSPHSGARTMVNSGRSYREESNYGSEWGDVSDEDSDGILEELNQAERSWMVNRSLMHQADEGESDPGASQDSDHESEHEGTSQYLGEGALELLQELTVSRAEAAELKDSKEKLSEENERLQQENQEFRRLHESMQGELFRLKDKVHELQSSSETIEQLKQEAEQQETDHQIELARLTEELQQSKGREEQLERICDRLKWEVKGEQNNVAELRRMINMVELGYKLAKERNTRNSRSESDHSRHVMDAPPSPSEVPLQPPVAGEHTGIGSNGRPPPLLQTGNFGLHASNPSQSSGSPGTLAQMEQPWTESHSMTDGTLTDRDRLSDPSVVKEAETRSSQGSGSETSARASGNGQQNGRPDSPRILNLVPRVLSPRPQSDLEKDLSPSARLSTWPEVRKESSRDSSEVSSYENPALSAGSPIETDARKGQAPLPSVTRAMLHQESDYLSPKNQGLQSINVNAGEPPQSEARWTPAHLYQNPTNSPTGQSVFAKALHESTPPSRAQDPALRNLEPFGSSETQPQPPELSPPSSSTTLDHHQRDARAHARDEDASQYIPYPRESVPLPDFATWLADRRTSPASSGYIRASSTPGLGSELQPSQATQQIRQASRPGDIQQAQTGQETRQSLSSVTSVPEELTMGRHSLEEAIVARALEPSSQPENLVETPRDQMIEPSEGSPGDTPSKLESRMEEAVRLRASTDSVEDHRWFKDGRYAAAPGEVIEIREDSADAGDDDVQYLVS